MAHKKEHIKKLKKGDMALITVLVICMIISYAVGYFGAKSIYERLDSFTMNRCLQQCNLIKNYVLYDYHSYTKGFKQVQDYYIECNGYNLLNITPIGDPILLDKVDGLCI